MADLVHLLGVSLWLGGLVFLLLGVLPRRRPAELSAAVSGYSTLAGVCVAAIAVAGAVLAWQVVGSFSALFDTDYGQLLLSKLAVLAAVLLIAQGSRSWVRTRLDIAVLLRGDRATVRPFVYSWRSRDSSSSSLPRRVCWSRPPPAADRCPTPYHPFLSKENHPYEH
jgi:hypothetical protein